MLESCSPAVESTHQPRAQRPFAESFALARLRCEHASWKIAHTVLLPRHARCSDPAHRLAFNIAIQNGQRGREDLAARQLGVVMSSSVDTRASRLGLRLGHVQSSSLTALLLLALVASSCSHRSIVAPEAIQSASAQPFSVRDSVADALCNRVRRGQAAHLEGISDSGAQWVIDKPARWNGGLIVYVHGYVSPALPPSLPSLSATRDSLLARGFAVAASSFSSTGYAVAEGVSESHALSRIFARNIGHPRRTYLVGRSLGGLIGMILSQRYPHDYDGSLLISGVVGGSDDEVQYMGDIRVLFDAVYPGALQGDLEHPPVITDPNTQIVGPVVAAVNGNPQGLGIIQALARRPLPGNTPQEMVESLITALGFCMQGGGDLFARSGGHHYFDNANYVYTSPGLPQPLIADVNARIARYAREPEAAEFLARYGEPAGPFRIPVMTLHTTRDPVVPFFHEALLAQVAAGPNLIQRSIDRYGHDRYSTGDLMLYFDEMIQWSESSRRPWVHRDDDDPQRTGTAG